MKTEIVEKYRDEEKRQVELQLVISGTSEKEENGRVCLQSPRYAEHFVCCVFCVEILKLGL